MLYVVIGALGFLVTNFFDFVALKKIRFAKPIVWIIGTGLTGFALVKIFLSEDKLDLPAWSMWLGWIILPVALFLQVYILFINLPLRKTYIYSGVSGELVKTGFYALVRHPGVHWFVLFMVALMLASKSALFLIAAPLYITLEIVLVIVQDLYLFPRCFSGYVNYRSETPFLIPNRRSIIAFTRSFKAFEAKYKEE